MSALRHKLDVLKQRCSEVGRDPSTLETSTLLATVLDGPTVIRTPGQAIFHVHAKDIRINEWISTRDG
jgi:sugar phosphate isomerase/epimerase